MANKTTFSKNTLLYILFTLVTVFSFSQTLQVSGNGTTITNPDMTPFILDNTDFGNVAVSASQANAFVLRVTVANMNGVVVSIAGSPDFSPTSTVIGRIRRNKAKNHVITFTPSSIGLKTAIVTVTSTDGTNTPYVFAIQGNGVAPSPEMDVVDSGANGISSGSGNSPSVANSTEFGSTDNLTPISITYTIENTGSGMLNIASATSSNGDFVITTAPAGSVAGGGSTTFTVTFTPSVLGIISSTITILNDDADENPYTFTVSGTGISAPLLGAGGNWSYLDDGSDQGTAWYGTGFDYSSWATGNAELGYGDGDEVTVVSFGPDSSNKYPTTYYRKSFTATAGDVANSTLVLNAIRDDGMVVYINGVQVWSDNMAAAFNYLSYATGTVGGAAESTWITKSLANILVVGNNEVAVEIHQTNASSSDTSFNFSLYTDNSYVFIPPTAPDNDADGIADYIDSDDDNDGVTDILEGCYTANLEGLNSTGLPSNEESILGNFPILNHPMDDGNQIDFSVSNQADFNDITSYFAGEHGWAMRVKGPGTLGTLTFDFMNDVENLFFKLVDFDENETWTVNAYDDTNTLIDLTVSNNVYHLGTYITQTGNTFNDQFLGLGANNNGDVVASDALGSVYFYFPGVKISKIDFLVDQPDGSTIRIAAMHFCGLDTEGDGIHDFNDADSDNDGIPDLVEAGGVDIDGDGIVDDATDTDGDGLVDMYDTTPFTYFSLEVTTIPNYDSDGDAIVNRIDLDSDNDGIVDLREVGDPDTDGNGMIDGFTDADNDGYHDAYDGAGSLLITGADTDSDGFPNSYPNANLDVTGFPNFMDIDSDDDGVTDNTEAQTTGSYVTLANSDSDSGGIFDGIDDNYDTDNVNFGGAGVVPVDSDGDGTPDYLDLDSDDSEEVDNIEGHDTNGDGVINGADAPNADTGLFTGIDSDMDGLDDGFDNDDAMFDSTNSLLQPSSHPSFDAGPDTDWRSPAVALDFDGFNDHVDFGDNHNFTGAFSLEAWVLQEATVATGTIISKGDMKAGAGNQRGYHLKLNSSFPNLVWYDNTGTMQINLVSPYAITNNRWYHIASTYDGATARLFIDGVEVVSGAPTGAPVIGSEKCILGASYDSDTPAVPRFYFDGFIDEVRVWNVGLTATQLHQMMNQEIEQNGANVRGKVIPLDISGGLNWANLEGYYPMLNDQIQDQSSNSKHGAPKNITTIQLQTAPLPYISVRNGEWGDTSAATPWLYGDTVWSEPNCLSVDGSTRVDWNIVQTSHDINSGDKNITVLGLISDTTNAKLTIADPIEVQDETNTGQSLRVTHYVELDGIIDLIGESQFLQDDGSIFDNDSGGFIERDQQGTAISFNYNYWSSSVGAIGSGLGTKGTGVPSVNGGYTIAGALADGTNTAAPQAINFQPAYTAADGAVTSPITISTYWLWKFNGLHNDYDSWISIDENTSLLPGEGYTMKGTSGLSLITDNQNYVFKGRPYNGDVTLPITLGNDRLIGNPYLSSIDANQFILDNIKDNGGNASDNIFNGALYFWDHFAGASHNLAEYVGGYATYTLMGGIKAISNDTRINDNGALGTKIPLRYISLNQGFFVFAFLDPSLANTTVTVAGGDIKFKNSQRVFKTEAADPSVSFRNADVTYNTTADERQKFRLMIETPSGYYRQLLAGIDEVTSNSFDLGFDAPLVEDNSEDGFWVFNESKFLIQAVNNFDVNQVLPLGVKVAEGGIMKFSLDGLENISNDQVIYLHDKETNEYRDLRMSDYEVNLSIGEYLNRFEVVFNSTLNVIDNNLDAMDVYYSNADNSIVINNPMLEKIESVEMFNMLGQSVYRFSSLSNNNAYTLKTASLSTGGYIVNIKTSNGDVSTKVLVK